MFWHAYTKYFNEYFYTSGRRDDIIWWSFFYSVTFDVIRFYPQHIEKLFEITFTQSVEELEAKFISELTWSKTAVLDASAFQGHSTTVAFLLVHYEFNPSAIASAINQAASTEFTETLSLLLDFAPITPETLFKALKTSIDINNVGSFDLLLQYSLDHSIQIDQDSLNIHFLYACQNYFLYIASTILTIPETEFPAEVFEEALKFASFDADSDIFNFLINQHVYKYTTETFDKLLHERAVCSGEMNIFKSLLNHSELFSRKGIIKALEVAIRHNNIEVAIFGVDRFHITPQELPINTLIMRAKYPQINI